MSILRGPIASGSIVADIVQRLESAIMAGELVPGERIGEQTIAKQLGVSRGALREALRQLEGRRLVERAANVGARIAVLSDNDVVEMLQVWEALGSLAARLAADLMTSKEVRELRDLVSSYETESGNRQRNFDTHRKFHTAIVVASKNSCLINMLTGILDILQLYRFKLMSAPHFFERSKQLIVEQLAIIDAISARDAAGAERAMRVHLANNLMYHHRAFAESQQPRKMESSNEDLPVIAR